MEGKDRASIASEFDTVPPHKNSKHLGKSRKTRNTTSTTSSSTSLNQSEAVKQFHETVAGNLQNVQEEEEEEN
jgi:hypothetical protein